MRYQIILIFIGDIGIMGITICDERWFDCAEA